MSANNYHHSNVTGETWMRAKRVVIENPLNESSTTKFVEERVVNIDQGEQYFKDVGLLEINATIAVDEKIPVIDFETGSLTGEEVTYSELHSFLKSAYIHFAHKRDNPTSNLVEDPIIGSEEP